MNSERQTPCEPLVGTAVDAAVPGGDVPRRESLPPPPPDAAFKLRYRSRKHKAKPHVVKFSGGRSSGYLLLQLLSHGYLRAERGDVVVFNNTSAEHPETYSFVMKCKRVAEERFGIPFFIVEFQTYEDARQGEWVRLPSYRLASIEPWSESNASGYRSRGEVFEELLSWSGYVPNQFSRICTKHLKIESTRLFLNDWFAGDSQIPRLGHYGAGTKVDSDSLFDRHLRNGGSVPRQIFAEKKRYLLSQPYVRPEQRFSDYSIVASDSIREIDTGRQTSQCDWINSEQGYLSFIGIRADENLRASKIESRASGLTNGNEVDGEYIYMPLVNSGINKRSVLEFWSASSWDLNLPHQGHLSNCVFCFLKGTKKLRDVIRDTKVVPGSTMDLSPSNVAWWIRMEEKYGRDLAAEGRKHKEDVDFLGFFGSNGRTSYRTLEQPHDGEVETEVLEHQSCFCRDE